jgi:hypothetical protein
MNHQVQQVADPYFRRVTCGNCQAPFIVTIHNVAKVLMTHICVPNWQALGLKTNGQITGPTV